MIASPPKVFISYAHSTPEHGRCVADLVATLRARGLTILVDTSVKTPQGPPEGWPKWMKRQLKDADWILIFFDEVYRRRFEGEEMPDQGLGATWEGAIITHQIYRASARNERFIPLLADKADIRLIPDELSGATYYRIPTQSNELADALVQTTNAEPESHPTGASGAVLTSQPQISTTRLRHGADHQLTPHVAMSVNRVVCASPSVERLNELIQMWVACRAVTNPEKKGPLLERFVAEFFKLVPGFRIPDDGLNLNTKTEELDVVVEIIGHEHHVIYGTLAVCECKNWRERVPGEVLPHLRDKLKERGCRFGVFVALNEVMPGFRDKMKAYLQEGIVISLLTSVDFTRLEKGDEPATILLDSYYATIKYIGEVPRR